MFGITIEGKNEKTVLLKIEDLAENKMAFKINWSQRTFIHQFQQTHVIIITCCH